MFKVGRKVKVTNENDEYYGRIGTVVEDDKSGFWPFKVRFSKNPCDYSYFDADELQLIEEEKGMNKSELKSGLTVVKLKKGGKYLVINEQIVDKNGGFMPLEKYDDYLAYHRGYSSPILDPESDWDIVAIKTFELPNIALHHLLDESPITWTWQREEVREVTMDEVEAMFKCKVKIKNADNK